MGSRRASQQAELARMAGVPLAQLGPQVGAAVPEEPPKKGWKRHTRLGRALEVRLDAQHGFYEHNKLAVVERQNVPIKWIGGKPTVVGKAIVDYLGGLADGRAVAFEVKNPSRGVIDLMDSEEVEPHQVAFLRRWCGLGFFVLCFAPGHTGDAVLVPAAAVLAAIDRAWKDGRKTAQWRESDAVAAGGVRLRGVDWLGGVIALGL